MSNNQNRPGGEQFEIIQLTKPQAVSDATERQAGKQQQQLIPNRTDLPQLMVKTPKDPTMAVETLKQLISSELLATAQANGYTELHGELEGLSRSIYLAVDDLVKEMLNQEEQTTMFSGNRLFDLLRNLAGGREANGQYPPQPQAQPQGQYSPQYPQLNVNDEKLTAIANFLKAVNFTFNRDEILNALSANLRFLSTYFSPSPLLSEKLGALAEAWGGIQARENFELLKSETVKLLYNVSDSLLNNEKTQILIPLIIHNLSRYNTNDYMLKEAFSQMLTHVPHSQKGAFMVAFEEFLDAVLYGTSGKEAGESTGGRKPAQAEQALVQNDQANTTDNEKGAKINSNSQTVQKSSPQGNNNTDSKINQAPILNKGTFPELYGKTIEEGGAFPPPGMTRDGLADGLRGFLLGRFTGIEAIEAILANLIEGTVDVNIAMALQADLVNIDSITMLVDYLNDILKQLPDVPEREVLFEMLSETVSGMVEKGELPPESGTQQAQQPEQSQQTQQTQQTQQPEQAQQTQQSQQTQQPEQAQQSQQTQQAQSRGSQEQQPLLQNAEALEENKPEMPPKSSLEELTSFIEKNINHNALKTLDSYNASNLLQSLINAPGVYTPLSHFIIPLQIGDAKAFGELWVDNQERGSAGGAEGREKNYHLFLTFEIEAVGRFETDLYATDTEVSLAVLHPESFHGEMKSLKDKINRIIASTSYSVREFQTGVLREPHDLTQIFPRIVEKRQGLDISI
ncbi:MAG: hypothetical protein FWF94_04105 [Oscillospiraceae bacterium]|nr:hypothetical protein [Oscillospiraceae bacterium]